VRERLERVWQAVTGWLVSEPKERSTERGLIRVLVPLLFIASGVTAGLIACNADKAPGVAFDNRLVFAGLLFLVIFYGALLLALPLVRAVSSGELPIELTTQGPRYQEKALANSREASEDLGERMDELEESLDLHVKASEANAESSAAGFRDLGADVEALRKAVAQLEER
jgi:hypothetical protein